MLGMCDRGCYRLKKRHFFNFILYLFLYGQRRALQLLINITLNSLSLGWLKHWPTMTLSSTNFFLIDIQGSSRRYLIITGEVDFYYSPAWEPRSAWSIKVNPLILELLNQAKNITVVVPSSLIKIWGKSVYTIYMIEKQVTWMTIK